MRKKEKERHTILPTDDKVGLRSTSDYSLCYTQGGLPELTFNFEEILSRVFLENEYRLDNLSSYFVHRINWGIKKIL